MCGIAGFWNADNAFTQEELLAIADNMSSSIVHRGPDSSGAWASEKHGVALGHRRLAIVDLTQGGDQPMQSACGRFILIYNGEVYNHRELSDELAANGVKLRGKSDTEVVLEAIALWGLRRALDRFVGMFAFALWSTADNSLYLCRDRMGEKPLYYGWTSRGTLVFGSELRALVNHPEWTGEIDRSSIALLFIHSYIPDPACIYERTFKLSPGCVLHLTHHNARNEPMRYWDLASAVANGARNPFAGTLSDATTELDKQLRRSISGEIVADVAVGAFLSGGIDSSTVVALMQQVSPRPVRTFTIGFTDPSFDEAEYARKVAEHLGTEHTELYVTAEDGLAVIPILPELFDEPFADSSQIPTFLVAQLAKASVTVTLSGDAGDELFGGYDRYRIATKAWKAVRSIPYPIRRALGHSMSRVVRTPALGTSSKEFAAFLRKTGDVLAVESKEQLYLRLLSNWWGETVPVIMDSKRRSALSPSSIGTSDEDFLRWMMLADGLSYLPGDILHKVDRAAMGCSLETRVPFLDHRIVEFAASLPLTYKMSRSEGKVVLRRLLKQYVPAELFDRPKMGFGIPMAAWLRGPLREWAHALLDERRIRQEGYLDADEICLKWRQHVEGHADWHGVLWPILMFQAWLASPRSANHKPIRALT